MLVANFTMESSRAEMTDIRLRLSNLEAQSLAWCFDFVIATHPDQADPTARLTALSDRPMQLPGSGLDLLGTPQFAEAPWRRAAELWIKTITFTVKPGATRSVGLRWFGAYPENLLGSMRYDGYIVLRLPQRRDPRRLMHWIPQRETPARILLAAEAILTQHEWPPREQRITGYGPPASLLANGPPIYGPAARPYSQIVHALTLASGRSEMEIAPEGVRLLSAIEVERTSAALVDRLERGEALETVDRFDQVDRLALFLDELESLGDNADATAAMNALLAQHGSPLLLTAPANAPRSKRKRRRR